MNSTLPHPVMLKGQNCCKFNNKWQLQEPSTPLCLKGNFCKFNIRWQLQESRRVSNCFLSLATQSGHEPSIGGTTETRTRCSTFRRFQPLAFMARKQSQQLHNHRHTAETGQRQTFSEATHKRATPACLPCRSQRPPRRVLLLPRGTAVAKEEREQQPPLGTQNTGTEYT